MSHPAVVVHGVEEALAALAPGLPVLLLSAPGAALYGGALWWRELVGAARGRYPATDSADALDCADAPGRAMAALRAGQRLLILDATCPAFAAVRAAASTVGAEVWTARPKALDLGQCDAVEALVLWLRQGEAASRRGSY